eukprot:20158-Amphidinium_carterae.1
MDVLYWHELVGGGSFEPKLSFEQEAEMRQTSAQRRCFYSPGGEAQPGMLHVFMRRELRKAALAAADKVKSVQVTFDEFRSKISDHIPTGSSGQRCPIELPGVSQQTLSKRESIELDGLPASIDSWIEITSRPFLNMNWGSIG